MPKTATRQESGVPAVAEKLEKLERVVKELRSELSTATKDVYETSVELTNKVARLGADLTKVTIVLSSQSRSVRDFGDISSNITARANEIFNKSLYIEAYTSYINDTVNVVAPEMIKLASQFRKRADKLADEKPTSSKLVQMFEEVKKLYSYVDELSKYLNLKDVADRVNALADDLVREIGDVLPDIRTAREIAEYIGWKKLVLFLSKAEEVVTAHKDVIELTASKLKQAVGSVDVAKLAKLKEVLDEAYSELEKLMKQ